MAARQQQQIDQQQQLLVAKEQRLKFLKQQEFQQHHMATEYDKLRRWVGDLFCLKTWMSKLGVHFHIFNRFYVFLKWSGSFF